MAYSKESIIKAIERTGGIINNAAAALGCSRQTIYNARDRWPEVAEAIQDERETLKDVVEEKLVEQVMQGNMTAIIFFLKCQAKERGYVERTQHEVSGRDGGPVETVDYSTLDVEQLERLRDGEDPSAVIGGAESGG